MLLFPSRVKRLIKGDIDFINNRLCPAAELCVISDNLWLVHNYDADAADREHSSIVLHDLLDGLMLWRRHNPGSCRARLI